MQKTKKQKHEQQIRKTLKTILNLQPELVQFLKGLPPKNQTLLTKLYPKIHGLQLLRILTLMEINFIVFSFLEIIERTKAIKVQNLKIGLIGGGVMGRLILNTLLVFTRQGLKTENILVSTRQPHHLQFYADNFGIKTFFDNQKIARQADLIFVATPATLDNWIVVDIKNQIQSRSSFKTAFQSNRTSYASTVIVQNSQSAFNNSVQASKRGETQAINTNKIPKKVTTPAKQEPINLNPFVYILTSDFTQQKCRKLFNFPVMLPWFRVTDISSVVQRLKIKLDDKKAEDFNQNPQKIIKQLQSAMSQWLSLKPEDKQSNQQQKINSNSINRREKMAQVLGFSCKKLENHWRKEISLTKIKNQIEANEIDKLYNQALKSKEHFEESFFTKSRKWRMAYNNFIA